MRYKKWLWALSIAVLFVIFSSDIDQYIAAATYTVNTKSFYGEHALWCKIIYHAVPVITVILVLIPLIYLFNARHATEKLRAAVRFGLIIYLALSLGPGLVVNVLFKDHWGRPRPYQVLRDGQQYSPFWVPHFSQNMNNSFPGGHASIGFFLGIPFLAYARKKAAIAISLAGGAVIGSVRILQGGHYLSDVLFAGIFVWLIAGLVICGISKWYKGKFSE